MKKIISLALALVMAISELVPVFADSGVTAQKSVEISPGNASVQDIKKSHPKLIISNFSDIENMVKTDEYTLKQYAKVKATADKVMSQSAEECTLTGYGLAKPAIDMILCYRVEKDRKYVDYLMKLLSKPRFYENVEINALSRGAELMFMAFMYDWLYDVLTVEERAHVLKCIKANLEAKRRGYETNASWTVRQMNINQIAQSCIIAAALAISDEEPQISDWFMKTTIPNLASRLGQYDSDGSFDEGPAYWVYVSQYLFSAFRCLETATGQTYGMANAPGMDKTGEFYIHINGPTGMQDFRYGDTPADRRGYGAPALFYLAKKFNNPRLGYWGKYFCSRYSDNRFANTALSILLYDPDFCSYDPAQTELDGVFHGSGEIGSMRSSWEEKNALQILYKGGGSIEGHSQLEAGNFVVNALGETWIKDLGWESYNISDMFTARLGRNNPRYKLYKNSSQGNNTFVINPQETTGQNPEHFSPITESYTGTDESYAVVDLTPAYDDYAVKAHRGYRIMDGKRYAIVQDEIELKEKGDYWWFVHTDKALNLSEDRRSILMSSGNNKLLMKIVSEDESLRFMITEEKPLYFTEAHDEDGENPGFRRIAINIPNTDKVNLEIAFIPIYNDSTLSDTENMKIESISSWKAECSEDAQLEGIYTDGRLIKNFRPDVANYFLSEKAGQVTVKAPEGTKVQILPSSEGNSTTEILVSAEGKNPVTYLLHEYGIYGRGIPGLKAKSIKSSIEQNEGNLCDLDYLTYWNAGELGAWFEMDFGQTVPLESVLISFKNGHLRTQYFELQVSDDGINYTNIGEFMSGGFTEKAELYRFPATKGRYLRFVGRGNSTNNYNFVNEIYAFETYDAAKEALDEENGHCIERIDVMCANKKLLVGESVSYEVKFTDVNMSNYKAEDAKITVINDSDVVLVDETKKNITANR